MTLIVHIGTPRTGTTTLQKHLFKLSKNNNILSKRAYKASTKEALPGILENDLSKHNLEGKEKIFNSIVFNALKLSVDSTREENDSAIREWIGNARRISARQAILLSTERFCDCSASLNGESEIGPGEDKQFPIHSLCQSALKGNNQILITLCLRTPLPYLRSKYIRTALQRSRQKRKHLSPSTYIHNQIILENNHPGTSALTPAMHSEFIKQLQQHAFVKAFGFQELLASDDVFSLMGLQGEEKYAFRDFPRENKLPFAKEKEQSIEVEITKALKQYGFYDRIIKAQMFA